MSAARLRRAAALAGALSLAGLTRGSPAQAPQARPPDDIRAIFAPGFLLQDRNADSVIDYVDARIVLPASPTEAEIVAAANVMARLGYETSALDLGRVVLDNTTVTGDVPLILIGATRLRPAGATASLAPGQGSMARVAPDATLRAGALRLEGGDASGLLAAAAYVAGRYPNVWGVRAANWSDVADRIGRYLRERNVEPAAVAIERIVVSADRPGVSRASVEVRLADTNALAAAAAALRDSAAARDTAGAARDTAGAATQGGAGARGSGRLRRSDLDFPQLHRLDVRLVAGADTQLVRLVPPRAWPAPEPQAFTARASLPFTLTDLYTVRGLYRDNNQDLVPDRTDAWLSVHGTAVPGAAADLAARVALETAGMRLPFADIARQEDHPENNGLPILFGVGHYRTDRLREAGKLHAGGEAPGEGAIELIPRALSGHNAIVITGGDSAGLRAITDYVAGRMPWLWEYGKGNVRLADLETAVRRFFQARETAGQTALAAVKLRAWLDRLEGRDLDSIAIQVATKDAVPGFDRWVEAEARRRFPRARIAVNTHGTGFGQGRTIFTEQLDIPWEVDDARQAFRTEALPKLNANSRGRIEIRVSEPPEVRARLEREIRRELASRGIAENAFDVVVLSAYKQGYSWLDDVILPRLRGRPVGRIEIRYHTLEDSKEVRWQQVEADTRWLQEIYPIDAVMARELGIPDSLITFTATRQAKPVYTVRALAPDGSEILSASFDPKYVVRPFFDLFPEYESVRVTTGWITVTANGDTLLDRRIVTDPERFWDHLQRETYAKIADYVMDVQDGRPSPANAPYFDEFRIELALSEPNYRIGIDEEVISSLEALHEDIYFETLTLFDLIGNRYGVGSLSYAGRVLPWIVPGQDGKPGRATLTLTGKERGVPELIMTVRERGGEPKRQRYPLSPLPVEAPPLRGIAVRAGRDEVARLLFEVTAIDSVDRYEEVRLRGSESQIDRQLLPVPLLTGMVDALRELHAAGILEPELSWDRVAELEFRFVPRDTSERWSHTATLARSRRPAPTRNPVLVARGFRYTGQRLVQWDTPIPPAENDSILARLATFPGVNVYFVTRSFLGKNIFAADFLPPIQARYVSQAKLNALKPTLLLSGRQHANEVSSTSHILRLGEMLATDSSWRALLRKVNVVLHPITNPDGAQVAYDMQRVNPDFMLHAGYLGALGVDATSGANSDDPIYPESKARPELQQTWLPDIFMNMHGYPSHEWVQYFAGYSGWVRGRTGTQRSWWLPRGWFVPGFNWVDDPRYPEIRTAQFAILDSIAAAITGNTEIEAMNRRMYARYAKYGRQDVENFREDFHNGILVYRALRGREASGTGVNSPRITYFAVTTEAPDETARGEWLELVASAGLAHSSALLRYLATGENRIEREATENDRFITRSVFRKKPVLPRAANANGGR